MAEHKQCDQCKQYSDHFPRRYRGKRFCGSCYWYFFIKRECSECHQIKRIHRAEKRPLCYHCYSKVTPCSRCGRVGRPVGKCLETGILCNSCANAFRPDGKCSLCGRIATVSIGKKFGIDTPICDTCRNQLHPKCPNCGIRGVLHETDSGMHLCYRCANGITYYCKSCHEPIKGAERSYCKQCYAIRRNDKRTEINAASFSAPETEKLFRDFIDWLTNNVGPEKSAQTQNRYAEFFIAIQHAPSSWPSDVFFLTTIEGGFLRKSSKPRLYLESIGVRFDASALKDAMDLRTINNNLMSTRENCGDKYLAQVNSFFDNRLEEYRGGKTKMLTIRIESSAIMRLFECNARSNDINKALQMLVLRSPGLQCSISRFLTWVGESLNLIYSYPELTSEFHLKYLLRRYLSQTGRVPDIFVYLTTSLSYFHGVTGLQNSLVNYSVDEDGIIVFLGRKQFWVPLPPNFNK